MSIPSGTILGPYEVIAPIGAGGMGEVYRARDTRLDRSVAIKILPKEFAANAALKSRFEREAKVERVFLYVPLNSEDMTADDHFLMTVVNDAEANPRHIEILTGWRSKMQ